MNNGSGVSRGDRNRNARLLGERVAAMNAAPAERPVDPARHVWVNAASGRQAGLLVGWVRAGDGT